MTAPQPLPHSTTGALASEKIHSWTYPPCSTGSAKMIIGLRAFERQSQMAGRPFAWMALPGTQYVVIS